MMRNGESGDSSLDFWLTQPLTHKFERRWLNGWAKFCAVTNQVPVPTSGFLHTDLSKLRPKNQEG